MYTVVFLGAWLTFCEPPELLGPEHPGGRDGVVADDPVVRIVDVTWEREGRVYGLHNSRRVIS